MTGTIGAVVVAVAAIGAAAALCWHGSIDGQAAVAIITTIIGGGAAGVAGHVGVKTGARAASRQLGPDHHGTRV